MKITCNDYGVPLQYEAIHPEGTEDARIIQIAFSDSYSYLEMVKKLRKKGFLNERVQFTLNSSYMTAEDMNLVILALKQEGYEICLYTDALQTLPSSVCECDRLTIRLYGMSQDSYSKSGIYEYTKVDENIKKIVQMLQNDDFRKKCCMEYQLFQFNMGEVRRAKKLADELGIEINIVYAEFNDPKDKRAYLSGNMSTHNIIEESKKYFFTYLDQLEAESEGLFEKFAGKAKIIIDAEGNFESEWNPDGRSTILTDAIDHMDSWLSWNRSMFYRVQEHKMAALLWLWNHNCQLNQNDRFRYS